MRAIEDFLMGLLELVGFNAARISLGDLFPGALIGFILAAGIGGAVSDWKYQQESAFISDLPWDWAASLLIFILSIYAWYLFASS